MSLYVKVRHVNLFHFVLVYIDNQQTFAGVHSVSEIIYEIMHAHTRAHTTQHKAETHLS